jgi:glycosyltransferase involved in cell wall biosynthesis
MQSNPVIIEKVENGQPQEMSYRKVVAIIPAYNEERFIGSVVLQAQKSAETVLVVDDGSSDATAQIADSAGATVLRHEQNLGKGAALNTGFREARALDPDIVIVLDADGQHMPEEMHSVAEPILNGSADIVVGSRYLERRSKVPQHRIWGHKVFNFMTNQVSGVHLSDSQSGFRAFSPRALEAITFQSNGFSVESEMQFLANEQNLKVIEVPITIQYLDKPKRPVMMHGLIVLNGVLRLVGQYRPLLFFGLSGLMLMLISMGITIHVVNVYRRFQVLPVGFTFLSVILGLGGMLAFFTGIILHSIRGLLLSLVQPRESRENQAG